MKKHFAVSSRVLITIVIVCVITVENFSNGFTAISKKEIEHRAQTVTKVVVDETTINSICNETNKILEKAYIEAMLNASEAPFWQQPNNHPFRYLTCEQLKSAIPIMNTINATGALPSTYYELDSKLSLQRLAKKLKKLNDSKLDPLKIVVIGGSMTTGFRDFGAPDRNQNIFQVSWVNKLNQLLSYKYQNASIKVINLAQGSADENVWLGNIDLIVEHLPIDIILVESTVNDQTKYRNQDKQAQQVHNTSHDLLNILMNLPSDPAVLSIELFRTAYNVVRDANRHCRGMGLTAKDPINNQTCITCPQWWMPQTWRKDARVMNGVSYISYRDAVWPSQMHPSNQLCQYWSGMSHPQAGVHAMVASMILFQFMITQSQQETYLKLLESKRDHIDFVATPENVCLNPISSFRALQGNPVDVLDTAKTNSDTCWKFRADSKQKYGWICESSLQNRKNLTNVDDYLLFRQRIKIGTNRRVILSHLVSYDNRMAHGQAWFTMPGSNSSRTDIWNIPTSHRKKTSITKCLTINLKDQDLLNLMPLDQVKIDNSTTLELDFNLKMLALTSQSSRSDPVNGTDKFKLLGIVTC